MAAGRISIRNNVKWARPLCGICAILSLVPFYDFDKRRLKSRSFGKLFNVIVLIYYATIFCVLTAHDFGTGINTTILLKAIQELNYVFTFALIIVCQIKNCLLAPEIYAAFLRSIDKLDGRLRLIVERNDRHRLTMAIASFVLVNPMIWEYYADFRVNDEIAPIYLVVDCSVVLCIHSLLNAIATFATMIRYRAQHVNDLIRSVDNGKQSNATNYVTLKRITDAYRDVHEVVRLFNELFSWPIALFVPILGTDVVFLSNLILDRAWDFLGFSIHDTAYACIVIGCCSAANNELQRIGANCFRVLTQNDERFDARTQFVLYKLATSASERCPQLSLFNLITINRMLLFSLFGVFVKYIILFSQIKHL